MNWIYKYMLLPILLLHACIGTIAQTAWPSPEVENMYNQAIALMSSGQVKQAIVIYQQAIPLAPDKMVLYRDLGKAYYLTGDYPAAQKTLGSVIKSNDADAQTFQVMAACLTAAGDTKKARNTLEEGIHMHPAAGLLYHDLGSYYDNEGDPHAALAQWLKGIAQDPAYHVNYYEAARVYAATAKPVWAILYGEIFVNIERQTTRANETRKIIMDAYKKIYSTPATGIPEFGKVKDDDPNTFEEAVYDTYIKLAPVVIDGITTENLTMLRTRFLMEWFSTYAARYPYALFTYQDEMTRGGYFDIYNEWLFGVVENKQLYDSWNKFHPAAISQLYAWMEQHKLQTAADGHYKDNKTSAIKTNRDKR